VKRFLGLAIAVGALVAGVWWLNDARPMLYVGGPVVTVDPANRIAEALLVRGDRIAAVGTEADVRAAAPAWSREVDLAGRALLPGFIDAHGHFPGSGIYAVEVDLNSPPIGDVEDLEDLADRLARKAAETAAGDWIVGRGYDDTLLAERRHPTRDDLDRVSRDHPIAIWHVSGHLAVVNGAGLAALGIDAAPADPDGGVVRRRPGSREPDGVLEESATDWVESGVPPPSFWQGIGISRAASRDYAAHGVTTAQNGWADAQLLEGLPLLSRVGIVSQRLVLWPTAEMGEKRIAGELDFGDPIPRWVKRGAIKLIADGSIQAYTGYLSQPYFVPPGDDPGFRGYPRIPRDDLFAQVERFHAAGFQLAIHGNGDAAIDDILDALEHALRAHPRADPRPIVVHAQMARDDQLDRMRALGVIPSFFSLHTYYWGDRHREIFMGPERAARMSPAKSALERGVRFTIHTDCPVVPMEPLRLLSAAVNRRSSSGVVVGPAQRIGVAEALRAITIDAAYQHFEEAEKGSLEAGKLADLVILSASPLDRPDALETIRVEETIVGGRTVFRAP